MWAISVASSASPPSLSPLYARGAEHTEACLATRPVVLRKTYKWCFTHVWRPVKCSGGRHGGHSTKKHPCSLAKNYSGSTQIVSISVGPLRLAKGLADGLAEGLADGRGREGGEGGEAGVPHRQKEF